MRLPNYYPDTNRFHLAGPPAWFLKQLLEFDASLTIIPSRQGFFYRLAQKRPLRLAERVVNEVLKEQADTKMLASYGLVPVTTILATANWGNPLIFEELRKRAPWRMGGAAAVTAQLESQERGDALKARITQNEDLTHVATDAWLHYNKKQGLRSHAFRTKTSAPRSEHPTTGLRLPSLPYRPLVVTEWSNPRT